MVKVHVTLIMGILVKHAIGITEVEEQDITMKKDYPAQFVGEVDGLLKKSKKMKGNLASPNSGHTAPFYFPQISLQETPDVRKPLSEIVLGMLIKEQQVWEN